MCVGACSEMELNQLQLGRALGHFRFSLIGLKRILFTNIFRKNPANICHRSSFFPVIRIQIFSVAPVRDLRGLESGSSELVTSHAVDDP